jgi:heat shock protein HslJ
MPAAGAQDPPLVCFGNEPSWSVSLETPDSARVALPDEPPMEYQGSATRIEFLRERVWRGSPASGAGRDLVAFLREAECSDGMSETAHPVVARVSLPDGRFLAGCCRIAAASAPPRPTALEGRDWRLVSLRGQDEQALTRLPHAASLRFDGGRLEGFSGCNTLVGSYRVVGDQVTLGTLAGTMMACEPPVMAVETGLREALVGTLRFEAAEDRLTLTAAADDEPRLVFAAAAPPRLEGIDWEVTGFNNGRHAVVSPLTGTSLSLRFEDGAIAGYAGCNSFRASYTVDAERLSIGPAAATRRACLGEGVMEQEHEFLAALESATIWAIDRRGMLDVHRADGERVLTADARAPESEPESESETPR